MPVYECASAKVVKTTVAEAEKRGEHVVSVNTDGDGYIVVTRAPEPRERAWAPETR